MSFLIHWIPTFVGAAILAVAGFLLAASERRDKRRKSEFWSRALSSGSDAGGFGSEARDSAGDAPGPARATGSAATPPRP